jgi:lipase chaperone LimK
MCFSVKAVSFEAVKQQEAANRMAALRKARRSPKAAAALQKRASLVGDGAKWRITNFKQVARAMSKWA